MRGVAPDTDTFTYYNANPRNRKTGDCVFRALAVAVNLPWNTVVSDMCVIAQKTGYSPVDKPAIAAYLNEKYGIDMQRQPRHPDNTKYTGKEFCREFKRGTYVISIGGHHISVVKNGKLIDIWDCTDKCVGNYWRID